MCNWNRACGSRTWDERRAGRQPHVTLKNINTEAHVLFVFSDLEQVVVIAVSRNQLHYG